MELDEFVTSVLSGVLNGILEAQKLEVVGPFVVPAGIGGHDYANHPRVRIKAQLSSTIVDFDIAVTAEDSTNASGGAGLKVLGLGANATAESAIKDTRVSRVQFAIPILLPESQKQWHVELEKK